MKKNNPVRSMRRYCYLLVIASLFLVSCATGLKVRSETDPSADFSRYTTYNFFEPLGIEHGYNSPIFGEHFRAILGKELAARGYKVSGNPDLLINVTIRVDDKIQIRSYTAPYMSGAYYSRPGGPYAGSALGVGVSMGSRATETTETSVFIDFVDFEQRRVVWQGVAVIDVNEKVAQHLRDAIYTAVDEVMKQYPHTAGK